MGSKKAFQKCHRAGCISKSKYAVLILHASTEGHGIARVTGPPGSDSPITVHGTNYEQINNMLILEKNTDKSVY